ncbi:MAG: ABC transporter permease subunit [Thermoanaerobaculia bacterium]
MRRAEIAALARLDAREVLRSRWPVVVSSLYGALAVIFAFAATRESAVLGFTGVGRVLLSLAHALLLLLPLLALAATSQTLNRAREDGSLELLLGHSASSSGYYSAVTLVRLTLLALPLVAIWIALPLLARIFFADPVPWSSIVRTVLVSCALLWAFVGLGMALSAHVTNTAKSAILGLLVWAATVSLLDFALIGALLQWRIHAATVFLLAGINPVQCARLALLAGHDPELSSFGPVGFYLAQHLGANGLLALGIGWPVLFGTVAWLVGLRRFRSGDLV